MVLASSNEIERFRSIIARTFGLHFDDGKLTFLAEVLNRRLADGGRSSNAYLRGIEMGPTPEERDALAKELTVGETYFFRNIEQFHALKEIVLPERIRMLSSRGRIRLLSAGCASGEEPYSLAMAAREALGDSPVEVVIRALDLNPASLEKAMRARYSSWSLRETPADVKQRWFRQDSRDFILHDSIRNAVKFEQCNLSDTSNVWDTEAYDVIFCRNVIMYLTPDHASALISRIARSLAPGGYLFLGHAETLRGISQEFHLMHTHSTFYYQRRGGEHTPIPHKSREGFATPDVDHRLMAVLEDSDGWVQAIIGASERIEGLAQGAASTTSARAGSAERNFRSWNLSAALDLLRHERFAEALEVVNSYPPESERDPDVLLLLAVLLTHCGQLERAKGTCERLLAIDELNAGAHYVLALCREGLGDEQGVIHHDRIAVYLDPSFAMPHLHLGMLARRTGNIDVARNELGQALVLLQREDASRLLLFGGGFSRSALVTMCRTQLRDIGSAA